MRSAVVVGAGLLLGVAAAAAILAGVVAFAPDKGTGTDTGAAVSPSLSPLSVTASPLASPIGSPDGSPEASARSPSAPSSQPAASSSASAAAATSEPATGLFHIGEAAPALLVPQLGGGTIDIAALRGKPVWVNFWQTTCPPCRDEFPLMNGFAARYADQELVILAIDVLEDEGTAGSFATELSVVFPIGLDRDGSAQRAWDAFGLPVHFWIDAEGIVRDGALGGIGSDVMAAGLGRIMPGVTVTP